MDQPAVSRLPQPIQPQILHLGNSTSSHLDTVTAPNARIVADAEPFNSSFRTTS